ncbi:SH3 domain-containing protein [Lysobacter sp. K5869]|uniref:SH3 domain-containing protein n=1 Tax=Lysobacter sp. K5869 TaxID=2820808 RepID=UPI001C0634B5|nr:SH3 domain-containing protein [Lysobacter sp. K5869]QWP78483.1 SH3 domain-containing protein [Lysobacter sp. K5869]
MRLARVIAEHRAPDRPAIRIARGDALSLGERDADWPQFVWAVQADGLGGWAPASLFDAQRGPATALADYDTLELDADAGQVLQLRDELAQWWWARDARGREGWVPARALELLD